MPDQSASFSGIFWGILIKIHFYCQVYNWVWELTKKAQKHKNRKSGPISPVLHRVQIIYTIFIPQYGSPTIQTWNRAKLKRNAQFAHRYPQWVEVPNRQVWPGTFPVGHQYGRMANSSHDPIPYWGTDLSGMEN